MVLNEVRNNSGERANRRGSTEPGARMQMRTGQEGAARTRGKVIPMQTIIRGRPNQNLALHRSSSLCRLVRLSLRLCLRRRCRRSLLILEFLLSLQRLSDGLFVLQFMLIIRVQESTDHFHVAQSRMIHEMTSDHTDVLSFRSARRSGQLEKPLVAQKRRHLQLVEVDTLRRGAHEGNSTG